MSTYLLSLSRYQAYLHKGDRIRLSQNTPMYVPAKRWEHYITFLPKELQGTSLKGHACTVVGRHLGNPLVEIGNPLDQVVTLLESETLYRAAAVMGPATWLRDVAQAMAQVRSRKRKDNVLWAFTATAPNGFCHPRSSMVGTLLEDLEGGLSMAKAAKRFADKMHPLRYQRPTEAPKAQNVARAEVIFEKLGLEDSLLRRAATLSDIAETIWTPKRKKAQKAGRTNGIFADVKSRQGAAQPKGNEVQGATMSWAKFRRTVLSKATAIDVRLRGSVSMVTLLTAAVPDAPPILQWDRADNRNPVSWYVWNGGSTAASYSLPAGQWVPVDAITPKPCFWGGNEYYTEDSVILLLQGAFDQNIGRAGSGLFPETLKSELHEVRSTIEAYSRGTAVEYLDGQEMACGLLIDTGGSHGCDIRVTTDAGTTIYKIDRFE